MARFDASRYCRHAAQVVKVLAEGLLVLRRGCAGERLVDDVAELGVISCVGSVGMGFSFHVGAEGGEAPVDSGGHGGDGRSDDFGHLLEGKVFLEAKDEGFAVDGFEGGEGLGEAVGVFGAGGLLEGRGSVEIGGATCCSGSSSSLVSSEKMRRLRRASMARLRAMAKSQGSKRDWPS